MRPTPSFVVLTSLAALAFASPARAGTLDEAAIHAEPQYYLISLPAAPVGEIAEAVLGEALGLPFKVDEDLNVQMRFQLEGMYSPKALAQEFGYRLWNADVALIEKPSDGLWLIPRSELAAALAQGATLVSPLAAAQAPAPRNAVVAAALPVHENPRRDPSSAASWSWIGWLAGGWASGAASVIGWTALRRRQPRPTALLPAPVQAPIDAGSDDLIIPTFTAQKATATQLRKP